MKFLLILHAISAIVLFGSSTHNGILAWFHMRGDYRRRVLQRRYAAVMFVSYLITFGLGLVIYPAFRVGVRPDFLDVVHPLATGFFECKEHLAALGLGLLLWYFPMSRRINDQPPGPLQPLYNFSGLTLMGIVWFSGLTGLMLVSLKAL